MFGAEFHRERSYSVFGGLPTQTAQTISASTQVVDAGADSVVARQGGPADKFFIVVDGELEVTREDGGSTETVATLGPGDLYGEMAILFDRPRGTSARATKPTKMVVIDGDTFRAVVAQSLGTTRDFDQIIRDRLGRRELAARATGPCRQTFSSKEFRATVGAFATGVTVVTTRGEEHAYGMTANAFSSVSLDPPLILVCVISPSEGADHISRNGVFAVNILSQRTGAAVALLRLARSASWARCVHRGAAPDRYQRLADPRGRGRVPGLPRCTPPTRPAIT